MEQPAGLAVVADAVRREFDAQERRADAADTRAGPVLGFAGLVASVGPRDVWPPLAVAARLVAGCAALAALSSLATAVPAELDSLRIRRRLLHAHPVHARLVLLDTVTVMSARAAGRLTVKLARLRLASGLVIAALALTITGATVEVVA